MLLQSGICKCCRYAAWVTGCAPSIWTACLGSRLSPAAFLISAKEQKMHTRDRDISSIYLLPKVLLGTLLLNLRIVNSTTAYLAICCGLPISTAAFCILQTTSISTILPSISRLCWRFAATLLLRPAAGVTDGQTDRRTDGQVSKSVSGRVWAVRLTCVASSSFLCARPPNQGKMWCGRNLFPCVRVCSAATLVRKPRRVVMAPVSHQSL